MEEIVKRLKFLKSRVEEMRKLLELEKKRERVSFIQDKMSDSNFWKDPSSSSLLSELKELKQTIEGWQKLSEEINNIEEILSLGDQSYAKEVVKELDKLEGQYNIFERKIFLSHTFDPYNAIVEINSGAGGTEACDWTEMLFRMYCRWAENKNFKYKIINEVKGEEAGIKNITFFLEGRYAYGFLKGENGVHRLVRISPFDANRRRHTSFASVNVLPDIGEAVEIQIKPEDLKIDTYRSSGAGGQHINRTDSAVRITHLPTGIVVACQNERSQYQNKQAALRILKGKLLKKQEQERKKELDKVGGEKMRIEWGSQIRSYILHPYLLVKDHRTNQETSDAYRVLDGDIDKFIDAYLRWISKN